MSKNLFIKTFGCQMNSYDSQMMENQMIDSGYVKTDIIENADMVIVNTCHIREKATDKLYSYLGRLRKIKNTRNRNGKNTVITVAGCISQAEGDIIFKRAESVDIVVGPESYHNLPKMVDEIHNGKSHLINLDFDASGKFETLPINTINSASAFVTIQEGCDKFCTFCVVPYTRGAEFSRPFEAIYDEAARLAEAGAKEIYLLGQNVSAYHGKDVSGKIHNLASLIEKIASIPEVERIRYTTSHPNDFDDEIYDIHSKIKKLPPFLHLPIQSGSNKILQEMNRKYNREDYIRVIEEFRKRIPEMAVSSDFIVAFPGESDRDFNDTMDLVEKIGFTNSYSFKYSPRPGTPAASMNGQVLEQIADERLQILQKKLSEQQTMFNKKFEGQILQVLFSDNSKGKFDGQILGKSEFLQSVLVENKGDTLANRILPVRIVKSRPSSLIGEII